MTPRASKGTAPQLRYAYAVYRCLRQPSFRLRLRSLPGAALAIALYGESGKYRFLAAKRRPNGVKCSKMYNYTYRHFLTPCRAWPAEISISGRLKSAEDLTLALAAIATAASLHSSRPLSPNSVGTSVLFIICFMH